MTDGVPPETGGPGAAGADTDAGRQGTGSLLDLLNVAAVVVDVDGRIVFWSPQATDVFGHTAEEALGRYAARLLLGEEDRHRAVELFATVMTTGRSWAGTFPVLHRDGTTRLVEFRNVRLQDDLGDVYALGIAVDLTTLHDVEDRLAFSDQLVSQAPVGLALLDADMRSPSNASSRSEHPTESTPPATPASSPRA